MRDMDEALGTVAWLHINQLTQDTQASRWIDSYCFLFDYRQSIPLHLHFHNLRFDPPSLLGTFIIVPSR